MYLGDILQASDDLSHAINSYKKTVDGQMINEEVERKQQKLAPGRKGTFWLQSCVFVISVCDFVRALTC